MDLRDYDDQARSQGVVRHVTRTQSVRETLAAYRKAAGDPKIVSKLLLPQYGLVVYVRLRRV